MVTFSFRHLPLPKFYVLARALSVVAAGFLVALTWRTVNLTPFVDESFFFGNRDPQLQEDAKIYKLFPRQDQLIINIEGKISSADYLKRVDLLTRKLLAIPEVVSTKSVTHGPKSFDDALKSSFWGRVLIPEDRKSSNVFVALDARSSRQAILKVEGAVSQAESASFRPVIAGIPYMIELIRRKLAHDLKVFSLSAILVFGLVIFFVFRSLTILFGCLTAGAAAAALTLLVGDFLRMEIGILTANLVTLVFVLTIPHLVYLTYNWKRLSLEPSKENSSVKNAFWETLPGSAWSTGTTLLGFLSLLLVQAKPLRQLGASGSIGTVCALFMAYVIYPWFLFGTKPKTTSQTSRDSVQRRVPLAKHSGWIAAVFVALCLLLGLGVFRLDTDPSLLSYFPEELRHGLERVDRSGGSSVIELVIRDSRGRKLDNNESYERLWQLQRDLERDREIGTVISLPLLMAEGEDFPFSFLFSWKTILNKMAEPRYERIARQFISSDHVYGHFILRMKELGRREPRALTRSHGHQPHQTPVVRADRRLCGGLPGRGVWFLEVLRLGSAGGHRLEAIALVGAPGRHRQGREDSAPTAAIRTASEGARSASRESAPGASGRKRRGRHAASNPEPGNEVQSAVAEIPAGQGRPAKALCGDSLQAAGGGDLPQSRIFLRSDQQVSANHQHQ